MSSTGTYVSWSFCRIFLSLFCVWIHVSFLSQGITTLPDFQGIKLCVQYLVSHPHKPIFYIFNYYYGSNIIRLTWNRNQVEDHKTQNCLEWYQNADNEIIINRTRSVPGIIHILLGVSVCCKLQILPDIASDSNYWEIRCMYKNVKKTNVIQRYMEALALNTGAPTAHWKDNKSCI